MTEFEMTDDETNARHNSKIIRTPSGACTLGFVSGAGLPAMRVQAPLGIQPDDESHDFWTLCFFIPLRGSSIGETGNIRSRDECSLMARTGSLWQPKPNGFS
jgi:hypothetical protein